MGIAGNFPLTVGELGLDLVGTGYPQLGHADVELHEGEQRVGAACLYMEPVRGSVKGEDKVTAQWHLESFEKYIQKSLFSWKTPESIILRRTRLGHSQLTTSRSIGSSMPRTSSTFKE